LPSAAFSSSSVSSVCLFDNAHNPVTPLAAHPLAEAAEHLFKPRDLPTGLTGVTGEGILELLVGHRFRQLWWRHTAR
jgi:hypothetical protein